MLDGVSHDPLRIFTASVDEGGVSAAARRLRRAQSVVSGLEPRTGVLLSNRKGRYLKLTPAGIALLMDARRAVTGRLHEGAGKRNVPGPWW